MSFPNLETGTDPGLQTQWGWGHFNNASLPAGLFTVHFELTALPSGPKSQPIRTVSLDVLSSDFCKVVERDRAFQGLFT